MGRAPGGPLAVVVVADVPAGAVVTDDAGPGWVRRACGCRRTIPPRCRRPPRRKRRPAAECGSSPLGWVYLGLRTTGQDTQAFPRALLNATPGPAGDDHATPWDHRPVVDTPSRRGEYRQAGAAQPVTERTRLFPESPISTAPASP